MRLPSPPQAAGSILAARDLAAGLCDVAVHWGGGMHHGMPYRAFGFCYVNDLVLAILELMAGCGRVLYIGGFDLGAALRPRHSTVLPRRQAQE